MICQGHLRVAFFMRTAHYLVLLCALRITDAGDWPQFLGPSRDGSTPEEIASSWDAKQPKTRWSKRVGSGFAGPVVFGDTTILFHRQGSSEIVSAFESDSGKVKWESRATTEYRDDFGFDDGPRSTPCIAGGKVYTMGAEGLARCVSLVDGQQLWAVNTKKEFRAGKGFFGMACSPLVHGSNVLLNIGGAGGAGIVAFDTDSGALRWKATSHEASYASPVVARFMGKTAAVFFTREGLVVLDPASGKISAERAWRARMQASVNAATPLVIDGMIFATSSYDVGAIFAKPEGGKLTEIWSGDDMLSSHYSTPVHHQGYLYGFHGRQETGPNFRCIELKTGRVQWDQPSFGGGSVTRAGTNLLVLKESGELLLVPCDPRKFTVRGEIQLLGSDTRAFPAVSNQRFFARDKRNLIRADLP
jgi:outer membrane protein assembly factor BamB